MADPTEERFGTLLVVSLALAFVLHASVAELWIRVTRRSGALTANGVKAEWRDRQRRQQNRWRRIETWLAVVVLAYSRIINRAQ